MGESRIVLHGPPYQEPRYCGMVQWDSHNVYLRHAGGGKDSRHSDGATYLTSTEAERTLQQRLPTSEVGRELVNFISLPAESTGPPPLRGATRKSDISVNTASVGTMPRFAVEIVSDSRLPGVVAAWESTSGVSSVQTCIDKGLGQHLVVAFAGSSTSVPSTSAS